MNLIMIKNILFLILTLSACTLPFKGFASNSISPPNDLKGALSAVYNDYKNITDGKNADYIPELAKVNPALFGIAIVTVKGEVITIGNANVPFAIESISKPFVYALALQDNGEKIITDKVGLNATGHHFNSVIAIEERPDHLQNPLVNAGAIQITSFIKGENSLAKWQKVLDYFKKLSDGKPYLGEAVYQSESATNQHNRAIAELLKSYDMLLGDPADALDRYTKACSVMVTARQLALMGATLANQGLHPLTHQQIISPFFVRDVLSQMVVNGLYENSGAWFWTVGIPAKSGVGGGILAVIPHQMAIVVFSPPLDEAGNSVRAQQVIKALSKRWHLHLLG